jgi:UDP-2,4-diacetamido-2,4,6-trideoxy-beta-L-altropyranose hydrolase
VLVMLGGTDPRGLTADVVNALADVHTGRFAPVVVRRKGLAGADAVGRACDRFAHSVWLEGLDASSLAGWIRICRLAVSACGGTLYELAALGLPFVGVVTAGNQRAFGREVAARWRVPVVEAATNVRVQTAAALRQLSAESFGSAPPSRVPIGGIDGQGVSRVADTLAGDGLSLGGG